MDNPIKIDKSEFMYVHAGYCYWDVRIGCIDIAHIFSPNKKQKRDYFIARLMFLQERGKVDFTKDKHFDTLEECKKYIHTEFRKIVKCLNRYYVLNNPTQ